MLRNRNFRGAKHYSQSTVCLQTSSPSCMTVKILVSKKSTHTMSSYNPGWSGVEYLRVLIWDMCNPLTYTYLLTSARTKKQRPPNKMRCFRASLGFTKNTPYGTHDTGICSYDCQPTKRTACIHNGGYIMLYLRPVRPKYKRESPKGENPKHFFDIS